MNAAAICSECGAPLMASAQRGVCPRCALRLTLSLAPDAEDDAFGHLLSESPPDTAPPAPGRKLGDYELIEELGSGGMGVIFKARQRSLDRLVALKLIRTGSQARPADIARFHTEAAAAGRLHHPHIVAIYEVGEQGGRHFYSMEFVPGQSLAHALRQGPFEPRAAARLLKAVAEAIHFAHANGVLHRDLKPSNILLDAERQPRVADFGLAKLLQSDSELTLSGAVIGSPHYMPPEQARGKSAKADARSDVYSLGAILYELLTGRAPFSAATPLETMKLVVEREPVAPRALNPSLPRDLETICLKCLAKEPTARYATAQELAEELGLFLNGEPICARPVSVAERVWRWCGRNPAWTALGAVLAIAPAVIIAVLLVMGNKLAGERNLVVAQEKITRQNLYAEDIALAAETLAAGNYAAAWRSLAEQAPPDPMPQHFEDLRGFEWRWLWQRVQGDADCALDAHKSFVNMIAYSPDGRMVVSGSADGTSKLWDTANQKLLGTFSGIAEPLKNYSDQFMEIATGDPVNSVCFTADNRRLLMGHSHGLSLFDVDTGQKRWMLVTNFLTFALCSSVDTNFALARAHFPRTNLALLNLSSGQMTSYFTTGRSDAICLTADGRAFARWDRQARRVWVQSVTEGKTITSFDSGRTYAIEMAFTPDGRSLALGNLTKGSVELFDVAGGNKTGELPGPGGRLRALAISPDGQWLATGGFDQTIHLWDLAARREVRQLHGHRSVVYALAFSPDSRHLASGGFDGTVRFWSVTPPPPPPPITNVFGAFAFSRDGQRLVTQDNNGVAHLWELPAQRELCDWKTPAFKSATFADGNTLLLASVGKANEPPCVRRIELAKTVSPVSEIRLTGIVATCAAVALSPDGAWVASGHTNGTLAIWSASNGKLRGRSEGEFIYVGRATQIDTLAFSLDGHTLVAGAYNPAGMRTWTFPELHPQGQRWISAIEMAVAISPDGHTVATGGNGEGLSANLWHAVSGARTSALRGHLDVVVAAAFSPDGRTLATGGADGSLKFWNLATGRDVATVALSREVAATYLSFSPDGSWLGAADAKGVFHLFHAPLAGGQ